MCSDLRPPHEQGPELGFQALGRPPNPSVQHNTALASHLHPRGRLRAGDSNLSPLHAHLRVTEKCYVCRF